MSTADLMAYKASRTMEPVVLLNFFVHILTYKQAYWEIDYYEAIPPFQWIDFAAAAPFGPLAVATPIAAATIAPEANLLNLEVYEDEFAQWRFFPLENMQVQLFNPAAVSKWQLKNLQIGIDKNIVHRDPTLLTTEFYTYEDERPAMTCTNFSGQALPAARIVGWGYRYHFIPAKNDMIPKSLQSQYRGKSIEELFTDGILPYTPIQCSGYIGRTATI